MSLFKTEITTFAHVLRLRAEQTPDVPIYHFLPDDDYSADTLEALTYAELDCSAQAIAKDILRYSKPSERALLLFPDGLEFIKAFYGCLYAGVIAVPGYPPKRNQKMRRIQSIIKDCSPTLVLTESNTLDLVETLFSTIESPITLCATDDEAHVESKDAIVLPEIYADEIAFLQYTSGSTGEPKGVMVSHDSMMANSEVIYQAMGYNDNSRGVSWLPLFHDMGLIGGMLQPVYGGFPIALMAPIAFLQKTVRWLQAISDFKATSSGGPNFAFDYCFEAIKPIDLDKLDLSRWQVAFSGSYSQIWCMGA